jgi:hypothetical protein
MRELPTSVVEDRRRLHVVAHHVGHEPKPGAAAVRDHHRLPHARMRTDGGLDLGRLDAVAADLHLVVDAAVEVQAAVGAPADEVPGAVPPFVGGCAQRRREADEPLVGEVGPVEVAAGDPRAADDQFAGNAHGHGASALVEHAGGHVRQRMADGDGGLVEVGGHHERVAPHGPLGGAVLVHEARAGAPLVVQRDQARQARLARHDHRVERRELRRVALLQQRLPQRRQREEVCHPFPGDEVGQVQQVVLAPLLGHDDGAAGGEGPEQAHLGAVERVRRQQQEAPHRCAVHRSAGGGGRHDVGVRDHHALGTPGGARGGDDVRQMVRRGRRRCRRTQAPGPVPRTGARPRRSR